MQPKLKKNVENPHQNRLFFDRYNGYIVESNEEVEISVIILTTYFIYTKQSFDSQNVELYVSQVHRIFIQCDIY